MKWSLIDVLTSKSAPLLLGYRDSEGAEHVGEGYWNDHPMPNGVLKSGWCIPSLDLWNSSLPTHWMGFPTLPAGKAKRKSHTYSEDFETKAWAPFPSKEGTSKIGAARQWERLTAEEQIQCAAAIPVYAKSHDRSKFTHHLEYFISRRIFETVALPASQAKITETQSWPQIMRLYKLTSNWPQSLGPPPGYPNCKVPQEYLG